MSTVLPRLSAGSRSPAARRGPFGGLSPSRFLQSRSTRRHSLALGEDDRHDGRSVTRRLRRAQYPRGQDKLPHYDFIFPDGHRSQASLGEPLHTGAPVSCGRDLYRIAAVREERTADPIRVELAPWPQQDVVLFRIHDITHRS